MNTRTTYQSSPMRQSENVRLPTHGIRTGPPQEQRNLPASTQSPIQRQGDNPDVGRRGTASLTANEEEKNVRAAAAFWAVMRTTHGFQGQAAAANDVAPNTEPGTSSRQQAEAFLESQGNPKRRRGSDDEYTNPTNHSLDTIITRSKRSKEFTGEYANPITTATSGVIARFPLLLPIRNSCELRGLCRRSYFGPRTCGGNITNVMEVIVIRVLNPGFPFSPLNVHFCV